MIRGTYCFVGGSVGGSDRAQRWSMPSGQGGLLHGDDQAGLPLRFPSPQDHQGEEG